jgi:hypothetical protein
MAIVRGLNENAVIWKYYKVEKKLRFIDGWRPEIDENGQRFYDDVNVYYLIRLYSRRCRTNGVIVDYTLKPFFDKLKIKLYEQRIGRRTNNKTTSFLAIGCETSVVSKEVYDNTEIHEVAKRYYNRIKNQDLHQLMDKKIEDDTKPIIELKDLNQQVVDNQNALEATEIDEEEQLLENWPNEPYFREYHHNIWV